MVRWTQSIGLCPDSLDQVKGICWIKGRVRAVFKWWRKEHNVRFALDCHCGTDDAVKTISCVLVMSIKDRQS